jgi:hypothetical protein
MKNPNDETRKANNCMNPQSNHTPVGQNHGVKIILTFIILTFLTLSTASAQYAILWHTIDGGGGTSTGGVCSVSGTIGQHDAGPTMTNGQYAVTGGFLALPKVIQTEGSPTLTIVAAGAGQAQISSTPATGTDWVLQQTAVLVRPIGRMRQVVIRIPSSYRPPCRRDSIG